MLERIWSALHLHELDLLAALDIAILAYFIYRILLLLRGRRALNMLAGLFALVLLHFVSGPELLNLKGIHTALGYVLLYAPFAIIVLFQNAIRQALARFVRNPLSALLPKPGDESAAEEIALAASALASRKIGALIVIERELGLRGFYETGILLDARISYDLLVNIFTPASLLHDGAVILAEGRIKAAACYLPLTTDPELSRTYGTRHRAAIGITEESDALAIVVSEERGLVSIAEDGRILEDVDAVTLRERLAQALNTPQNETEASAPRAEAHHV